MIPKKQGAIDIAASISREFAHIGQLSKEGKVDEAWRAANELYGNHPGDATANFVIALLLVENNQRADALQYAEAAVKFSPVNVRNLVFLGKLYVDLGMIEYAPAVLHKAFALDDTAYQAPWALAEYYLESGQGGRALPYFEKAMKAAPASAKPEIQANRARCLRNLGRVKEAETEFELLSELPKYRIQSIAGVAMLGKNDHASGHAERIRRELEQPALSKKDRSELLLCLGRLHENGRDYDTAFSKFEESRRIIESKFNAEKFESHVSDNIKVLKREVFEKLARYGHASKKPIFIVGMPRSGTTMTEQIIAGHSQVEGVGELDRMSRMAASFSSRTGMQEVLDKMISVGPEQWKNAPQQYLNLINALAPDALHTVDKMPHNFLELGFIHLCFPNARIIHCRRNPIDTFISSFQNPMSSFHGYSYDQVSYGKYYARYLELMEHWKAELPSPIYESSYEALTANPEAEVRNMLDFLGLPWEESCLKFSERESTVKTFSQLQVRAPIGTASVGRWKRYEKHLGPLISVLHDARIDF